ncbi:MAG: methyltransferase domain-containing protein [Spirochaetia bacterium]|nr:methyltransferase domain-containing protein [Spirochaetia bacterium]
MRLSSVEKQFSKHSSFYDQNADLQKKAANTLIDIINPEIIISDEPILEIGCGTGLFSEKLAGKFYENKIIFTDISEKMLSICRTKITDQFPESKNFSFKILDAEKINSSSEFSLIVSGFAFQWFFNIKSSLKKIINALTPGGFLIFSLPVAGSFPEWEKACRTLGLHFPENQLPGIKEIESVCSKGLSLNIFQNSVKIQFPSSLDFFRSLKKIGASYTKDGSRMSASDFKKLIRHLDRTSPEPFQITYKIAFIKMQKTQ